MRQTVHSAGMSRVLLLTAAYGEGHNAAARGLHTALTELGAEAEIIDVFTLTGGVFYERSRRAYLDLINHAPRIWAETYALIDRVPIMPLMLPLFGRARRALGRILEDKKPDVVVSVYPAYGYFVERIFREGPPRPFAFHTIVTDSITINSIWHRCPSDTFIVANQETADVMAGAGVSPERLRVLGFPVPPRFARDRPTRPAPGGDVAPRVLFMVNAGKDAAPAIVARLLEIPGLHLTVTVGRDEVLEQRVREAAGASPVEIHGWTEKMPELLMSHHLLIGKAGGAAVQETIAAGTPMLITHVVPGQEEGNARLLIQNDCGAVRETPEALGAEVERLFANGASGWLEWERNIARLTKPDAALKIAELVLNSPPGPAH